MVRGRVRPTPCIESLPDKGGQVACPVECSGNSSASLLRAECVDDPPAALS
ncbi:hypothetical protein A2U01_0049350 [Trifolium medium]|uniref:Uncharacterized protein n=1 Tax=Trifolium medium TaxID=97028 RepID=A0A392QX27_9FABA|nr:hypothetical protein [Trifolium medium]